MSSPTTGSQPPQTTSSGSKGNRSRYPLETPPPADNVSHNPGQVGTRYGWVEIIGPERRYRKGWSQAYVPTRCTGCGATQWQSLSNLMQGKSKGCQACSQPRQAPRWLDRRLTAAKQRCTNPDDPQYKNYGARGITFDFDSVMQAGLWVMGNLGLHRELELDRINNDGPYAPGNLRWATRKQQASNRRCVVLEHFDQSEWPYSLSVVRRKLSAGLTREQIIEDAEKAVQQKRKCWRLIQARLEFMTSSMQAPDTDSPSAAA